MRTTDVALSADLNDRERITYFCQFKFLYWGNKFFTIFLIVVKNSFSGSNCPLGNTKNCLIFTTHRAQTNKGD